MKILYTTIAFLFIVPLKAQQADRSGITADFIYNFMATVIKQDSLLNANYALDATPSYYQLEDDLIKYTTTDTVVINPNDTVKWVITDTLHFKGSNGEDWVSYTEMPAAIYSTIHLQNGYADISIAAKKYMLAQISKNKAFKWDKKRLGLVKKSTSYSYQLSLPLFSRDKKQALLLVRMLCPGLCGTGQIYLYTQTGSAWSYKTVSMWMH